MILWRNIPARLWLWWHRNHSHNLTGSVWTCSCRATLTRPISPATTTGGAR